MYTKNVATINWKISFNAANMYIALFPLHKHTYFWINSFFLYFIFKSTMTSYQLLSSTPLIFSKNHFLVNSAYAKPLVVQLMVCAWFVEYMQQLFLVIIFLIFLFCCWALSWSCMITHTSFNIYLKYLGKSIKQKLEIS